MNTTKDVRTRYLETAQSQLLQAGFTSAATDALLNIDSAVFQWARMLKKGEVAAKILHSMNAPVDVTQFNALTALIRIENGIGRAAPEEATIGLLAEELSLDPSRASRIATDLIEEQLVLRQASQSDGRKSVLVMTERAKHILEQFMHRKWQALSETMDKWSDAEIQTFASLLTRYVDGIGALDKGRAE